MQTPLYKELKKNGTTFYAFPGANEDISSAYQNENFKMYFSKFALLNIPVQVTEGNAIADNDPIKLDFDYIFPGPNSGVQPNEIRTLSPTQPADMKDQLIQSLRSYVANQEITLRKSKIGDNEFYYDHTQLPTVSEPLFWKWAKKIGIIDFEVGIAEDEWFDNLDEFNSNKVANDYFREYLWKEREVLSFRIEKVYQSGEVGFTGKLEIEFSGQTNFRVDDIVIFAGILNSDITFLNGLQLTVLKSIDAEGEEGNKIIFDLVSNPVDSEIDPGEYSGGLTLETEGTGELVYNRLVQYVGEITAVNNVQESNRAYTEVYANVSDAAGKTPDVLFRTTADENYKPNIEYPFLPVDYQPEIIGGENYNSPIVQNPQNYPGDFYGQFDTANFTYKSQSGDVLRRSGDYYGIFGDINDIKFEPANIDGIRMDFDKNHYVKMNILNRELSNFDEFNTLAVNNLPPQEFEFNAILWYYSVEDNDGNVETNVYGVSFVDNPDNNPNPNLIGLQIPTYKKFVNDGIKDGTSYQFSLNLNFNIINDNSLPDFTPNNVNSLFSFNLFNDAMKRLSSANEDFLRVISNNDELATEIADIKQLLYTQTELDTLRFQISNLEDLLKLYSSMQLSSSDTVEVIRNDNQNPPTVQLNNIDTDYKEIFNVNTTDLYNSEGSKPLEIAVPTNKNFLVNISNNDESNINVNDNLSIVLDRDLYYKQSMEVVINASENSTQNKKLDIFVDFDDGDETTPPVQSVMQSGIDLPVYFNSIDDEPNTAFNWEQIKIHVDLTLEYPFVFEENDTLRVYLPYTNGLNQGDTILLNNFIISSNKEIFSGQYTISAVDNDSIVLLIGDKEDLLDFAADRFELNPGSPPYDLPVTEVFSMPFISFNKGLKYKITRINNGNDVSFDLRYKIEKSSN